MAGATVGNYLLYKLDIVLLSQHWLDLFDHVSPEDAKEVAQDLADLPLDSNVGQEIKKIVDAAEQLVEPLRREGLRDFVEDIQKAVLELAMIWYFG